MPLLLTLLLSAAFWTRPPQASAQAQAQVNIRPEVSYEFAEQIVFEAEVSTRQPVEKAVILFGIPGDAQTYSIDAEILSENQLRGVFDLHARSLRAFAEVEYRFHLTLADGSVYTSEKFRFTYEDNRFEWQTLEDGPFQVHWYSGDIVFAQSALDVAHAGLARIQGLIAAPTPELVVFYIYANPRDMEPALPVVTESVVAGHADTTLDVVVIAVMPGPEQQLQMEQRIPHELMHILFFQVTGRANPAVPAWFSEGLASMAELYPNPDYQISLNNAYGKDALLPMDSLCVAFPRDVSNAILAYAQSASFTRYLHQTYGVSGLNALMESYADRLECQRGFQAALDRPLGAVEREWRRAAFAENPQEKALAALVPWALLLLAALGAPLAGIAGGWRRVKP
jgi:hypothetical protein